MQPTNNQPEGSDALIHLRVPAGLKAQWVRESRQAGAKLTDWIVKRLERKINVFKVPDALAKKYHGEGRGLAAIVDGQLVDIVYLSDLMPDFVGERADVVTAITSAAIAPTVRRLQALGSVHMGILSCWEFVEL